MPLSQTWYRFMFVPHGYFLCGLIKAYLNRHRDFDGGHLTCHPVAYRVTPRAGFTEAADEITLGAFVSFN